MMKQATDSTQYRLAYRPVEMGCLARITGHRRGCNEGRIVRVLVPLQPNERYGHAQRRAPKKEDTYWQVVALDGGLLEYVGRANEELRWDTTVAVRTGILRRLKENQ